MQAPRFKQDPDFFARWHVSANRAPASPRLPLSLGDALVGSVAQSLLDLLAGAGQDLGWSLVQGHSSHQLSEVQPQSQLQSQSHFHLQLPADPSVTFAALQHVLQQHRPGYRPLTERLALRDGEGQIHGSVPRDLARVLGIHTHSVHLVGQQSQGCWVQERAAHKSEDPGQLDTLVGGTVAWDEVPPATLARETWEEAGLNMNQLEGLTSLGEITLRYPSADADGWGYQLETVHCFSAHLVSGVQPAVNDEEVAAFYCLDWQALDQALAAGRFTLAATGVLSKFML